MGKGKTTYIKQLFNAFCQEFSLAVHDGGIVLFFLFLPLAYPVIYSLIYNPELVRDVRMVVVDHDRTPRSRELVRNIDATQEVWVTGYAADLGEAKRAMNSHDCYGILEIPSGFGRKVDSGENANAVLYCEMSLLLRYRAFLVAATNVAQEMSSKVQMETVNLEIPLAGTIATGDPMPVANIAMGNITAGFDSFIMPGVVILILHQCLVLAVGMAGGTRREKAWRTGIDPFAGQPSVSAVILGQALCYLCIIALPCIFLIHYVPLIFSFPMEGNALEIFAFITPMLLACIFLGLTFQGIVWERESVFLLWVVTSVAFLFLSGLTWPRYAMSDVWRVIGDLVPATWGVEGFIKMNANGSSLSQVRSEYINLWILAFTYFLTAWMTQRFVVRRSTATEALSRRPRLPLP